MSAVAKRFRTLRRLQFWGLWARGFTLERIGRELGGLDGKPITRDRARQLVAGGRLRVRKCLGSVFVERVDAARLVHRQRERERLEQAIAEELEREHPPTPEDLAIAEKLYGRG